MEYLAQLGSNNQLGPTLKYLQKLLDQYWQHQDIIFDFRAQIEVIGSRGKVLRVNIV